MSLVLQSSGGGSVTLQEAVTASNLTITVPAVTGTMLTTASAGTVLQVVQGSTSTQTSTSSATFSDTGLTATITPTSATSKILVIVNQVSVAKTVGSGNYIQLRLLRNLTTISYIESLGAYTAAAGSNYIGSLGTNYLDSPATTSATTYKTQFCNGDNANPVVIQTNNGFATTSTITLLEIAA